MHCTIYYTENTDTTIHVYIAQKFKPHLRPYYRNQTEQV